mmetsp:Transcript_35729/g.121084  ORF Transcript_35729/g.121084 Transcript_35729/m.121084 type:complete len:227 (+) Transcript_35729:520-1200(+)
MHVAAVLERRDVGQGRAAAAQPSHLALLGRGPRERGSVDLDVVVPDVHVRLPQCITHGLAFAPLHESAQCLDGHGRDEVEEVRRARGVQAIGRSARQQTSFEFGSRLACEHIAQAGAHVVQRRKIAEEHEPRVVDEVATNQVDVGVGARPPASDVLGERAVSPPEPRFHNMGILVGIALGPSLNCRAQVCVDPRPEGSFARERVARVGVVRGRDVRPVCNVDRETS